MVRNRLYRLLILPTNVDEEMARLTLRNMFYGIETNANENYS